MLIFTSIGLDLISRLSRFAIATSVNASACPSPMVLLSGRMTLKVFRSPGAIGLTSAVSNTIASLVIRPPASSALFQAIGRAFAA